MNQTTRENVLEGPVQLEIVGGQGEITTTAAADCYYKNGHYYLMFQEEIGDGTGKDVTVYSSRLKISKDEVVLRRSLPKTEKQESKTVMEMTYKKEPGSFVNYPTPYGFFHLDICTDALCVKETPKELTVHIDYRLTQEEQEVFAGSLDIRAGRSII